MGDRITVPHIVKMKQRGERITCLTAYDYSFARILDEAGVEKRRVRRHAHDVIGARLFRRLRITRQHIVLGPAHRLHIAAQHCLIRQRERGGRGDRGNAGAAL